MCTGTLTLRPSSPGNFISAEKPATWSTGREQRGNVQCSEVPDGGEEVEQEADSVVRMRMQVLQNWSLQGRMLGESQFWGARNGMVDVAVWEGMKLMALDGRNSGLGL